jgi:hypothetical protein
MSDRSGSPRRNRRWRGRDRLCFAKRRRDFVRSSACGIEPDRVVEIRDGAIEITLVKPSDPAAAIGLRETILFSLLPRLSDRGAAGDLLIGGKSVAFVHAPLPILALLCLSGHREQSAGRDNNAAKCWPHL